MSVLRILYLAILTEALVELVFKAAPLQGIRIWLIKKTPILRSTEQGHLLECKYCTSVWIAIAIVIAAAAAENTYTTILGAALVIARVSNYVHSTVSWIRDLQINLRLERK